MGDQGHYAEDLDHSTRAAVVSLEGRFLRVSPGLADALGLGRGELMEVGPLAVTHPADRDRLIAMLGLMRAGSIAKTKFRQRWLPAGGEAVEGLLSGSVIHGKDGAPVAFAFTVEIATPLGRQPEWESLIAHTHDGIAVIGPDGRHLRVNETYAAMLGSVPSDLHELPWLETVPGGCRLELERAHAEMLSGGRARFETLAIRRDGSCFEAGFELVSIDERDGGAGAHLCLIRDLTARTRSGSGSGHDAGLAVPVGVSGGAPEMRDGVTGLPAVSGFVERLERALSGAGTDTTAVLVLGVETERRGGRGPGAEATSQTDLLRGIAQGLGAKLGPDEFLARLGDWSFGILSAGGDELTLAAKARCLLKAASPTIAASGAQHMVHATLGIAIANHGDDARELILAADRARRRALELGADRFEFSEVGDLRPDSPVQELLGDVREALGREQLRLRYQPVFDLADRSISGVEALLRWEHPSRTVLTPEMFLPAARRSGAIVPIGRWVLEHSLRQLERWNEELVREEPLRLFINLSAQELADPTLAGAVELAAERGRISPGQLALDVSDVALMDIHGPAWGSVVALRELGAAIVLDRFGTTFTTPAQLERLPVDMIKLDRSCVAGVADHARHRATVKAAGALAEARGLTTIACGVETERQVQALVALGCHGAQGFLFAEPRAARAVTKLLRWRGERVGPAAS
jgi:PAS domain S-box-containing protein